MEFTITALNGDSVKVESENWMTAMGKALGFFDIDIASIEKLTCSPAKDGSVFVEDAAASRSWMVRMAAPEIAIRVTARSEREQWQPLKAEPTQSEIPADAGPPPDIAMPVQSSLKKEESASLAERLFDLSMDIATAEEEEACGLALDLILEFVAAQAASVVRGTLNDPSLKFVAARGPVSSQIVGREIQFGEGLIGMCFDMRGTLMVNDVASDTRHLDQFDQETGFETLAVLCVPILDDDNMGYGVIQLINPPDRQFTQAHVEVVETVAKTLANSLATR